MSKGGETTEIEARKRVELGSAELQMQGRLNLLLQWLMCFRGTGRTSWLLWNLVSAVFGYQLFRRARASRE